VETLGEFLDLWFGPKQRRADDQATMVGPLLQQNCPAPEDTSEDGVDVLVVENQGVWLWGRNTAGRYVERENEPGVAWRETGENTEEFWLHHAAFEALWSMPARRSAQGFDAAAVSSIERAVTPLPCRPWSWPGDGHALFHKGAAVVMISHDERGSWVVASAPTEPDLVWLDDLGLMWDESDTRRD
jgi:hypothetical protein